MKLHRSAPFAFNLLTFLIQLLVGGSYDAGTEVGDSGDEDSSGGIVEKDYARVFLVVTMYVKLMTGGSRGNFHHHPLPAPAHCQMWRVEVQS